MATQTRVLRAALDPSSLAARLCPVLDISLVAMAAAVWYVHPQEGAWPLALIGIGWLLRFVVYGYLTQSTPFDLPLLLFLASAFLSVNLAFSQGQQWLDSVAPLLWAWAKFWTIVPALALFVAVANLRGVRQVWWFARVYACLAVATTLYFVATNDWQVRGGKFDLLTQLGALLSEPLPDVPGRRLHPNVFGGVIAMLVPFCLALWREARARRREFIAWGAVTLIALFGLLMSASRGAWLAVAFVALVWALWRELSAGAARSRVRLGVLAPVLLGGALVLGAFADLGTIQVSANPGASSVISRIALWQGGLSLAQDYLFTGGGLGAFPMLYSTYVLQVPVFFIAHAHNVWLDMVLDQGLLGLIAFGWLLVLACVLSLRGLRLLNAQQTRQATLARWLLEAALASLLVTLVHGLVDDIAFGSRALLLLFVPFGVMAALYRRFPAMQVTVRWRVGFPRGRLNARVGSLPWRW
ncbi:MAG: O-antigen ligase family protein, partial [Chloroflexi bacterium]